MGRAGEDQGLDRTVPVLSRYELEARLPLDTVKTGWFPEVVPGYTTKIATT